MIGKEESKLKHLRAVESASARYQQYVQLMSEFYDMVQVLSSNSRAWITIAIDAQKSALDLYRLMLSAAGGYDGIVPELADASARHFLQAAQGWSRD
ncbi:hypothetical protein [Bradyrhizobium yuanmingense]|uniref:Uncharacterized protein n=1 Tax=Bradyrhizobium yuanmingense TaxID=108015 RepID=A0A1C3XJ55_9BRAD|nr:hypothetical protein [Bradyrhizobium yuanmingense]MCA1530636.1 hypothetical protein [Bradyrhizobium yuanmingense]TWI17263.1 hypothetical protein IQ15_07489 [Bradyrhizobium yuanmingense]SCB52004.1 hypothetical protein GA0061099_10252 [Bradyrhizobium yuanmingense]